MRTNSAFGSILLLAIGTVRASTLTVALGGGPSTGSASTAMPYAIPIPGESINVYVFAKDDTIQNPADNSSIDSAGFGFVDETLSTVAGGISGFEFSVQDIAGGNSVNYNAGSATTFANTIDFSHINPSRTSDGVGGFYAAAASLYNAAGPENYTDTVLGTAASPTLMTSGAFTGYDLIATEKWTISPNATVPELSVTIVGPQYFDSTNGGNNFLTGFTNVITTDLIFPIPEPVPASMLSFGVFGFLARRKSARPRNVKSSS